MNVLKAILRRRRTIPLAALALLTGVFRQTAPAGIVLDDFEYHDSTTARERWQARDNAPLVRVAGGAGLVFNCPFDRIPADRFHWDRSMALDLSAHAGLSIELTCDHPEAMRSLALYLRSGEGWYVWNRPLPRAGRQTLYLARADFSVEGNPAGWQRIDAVRLSPWRGDRPMHAGLLLHGLRTFDPPVLLVRGTLSTPEPGERAAAARATRVLARRLTALGVPHAVVDEDMLMTVLSDQTRILILGYNHILPAELLARVKVFLDRGGKALVFYSSDQRLARRMGFELQDYIAARTPGQWAAFSLTDPGAWRAPSLIRQRSWNLRPLHPARPDAEIIAWWEDSHGQPTGHPAWVASHDGAWMSHVLQEGDNLNKENLLVALLTRWMPELWPPIMEAMLEQAGRVGPHRSFTEAVVDFERAAGKLSLPERRRAETLLARAGQCFHEARRATQKAEYIDAFSLARACRRLLTEVLALTMPPREREFRGVWDHDATGWYPGDWDRTARELRAAGLGAVFSNIAWGGLGHYVSEVLPSSATLEQWGDQLTAARQALKRHGLEFHAWIVCWNLGNAPADFIDRLRRAGRLQIDIRGNEQAWLCPAHPENRRHMLRVVGEIAAGQPNGIHLDYIRFPGPQACFCDVCRQQVESRIGRPVKDWPAGIRDDGEAYAAWSANRVAAINAFVSQAYEIVKSADPGMLLSAAVFGSYPGTVRSIGQDWGAWLHAGWLDFVVPMNYTADAAVFARWIGSQRQGPASGRRLIPGIGVSSIEAPLTADQVLEQIGVARRMNVPGYVLFSLDMELRQHVLPFLRILNRERGP